MKLIILDQNGVINKKGDTLIRTPDDWKPIPGSLQAIARLTHAGYRVVTATNQSGIGRGLLDMTTFNAINDKLLRAVQQEGGRIDALFFCPHTRHDKCACRKPNAGMFKEIRQRYGVELDHVPAVGDSLRDLQAAAKAGAVPVLVLTGKGQITQEEGHLPEGTQIYPDLSAVADSLEVQAL